MTEIKDAYIRSCKECHPDVNNSPEAANKFREVREAYRVLSNSYTKISYDFEIGNMKNDIGSTCDNDDLEIKSARRDRNPMDSVAERTVKQRWREDIIRRRKKMQEGEMSHEENSIRLEKERYKQWERRFSDNVGRFTDDIAWIHSKHRRFFMRVLLITGIYIWTMLIISGLLDGGQTDFIQEKKDIKSLAAETHYKEWTLKKRMYFKENENSAENTVKVKTEI